MENYVGVLKNFKRSRKNEQYRILKNRLKAVEGFFLSRFGKRRKDNVRLLLYQFISIPSLHLKKETMKCAISLKYQVQNKKR